MTWGPTQGFEPGAPFADADPGSIPNLASWFDAADPTTITTAAAGARIVEWRNKGPTGPAGYLATGANSTNPGPNQVNGLNAVGFDGDAFMDSAAPLFPPPPFSFMGVFVTSDLAALQVALADGAALNDTDFMEVGVNAAPGTAGAFYRIGDGTTVKIDTEPDIIKQGRPYLLTIVEEGNARVVTTINFETPPETTVLAPTVDRSTMGKRATLAGGDDFGGAICEFAIYTRTLALIEFVALRSHFWGKWGITNDPL